MKMCLFMRGMAVGIVAGVLLDNALRPSPKFKRTQAGKAVRRLSCAVEDAVDELCTRLQ